MNGQGHAAPVRFSFFVGFFSKTGAESLDHPGTVTVLIARRTNGIPRR